MSLEDPWKPRPRLANLSSCEDIPESRLCYGKHSCCRLNSIELFCLQLGVSCEGFKKMALLLLSSMFIQRVSLAILSLNVAGNVHEEGDGEQEGLHDVGDIEEATSVNLRPLGVIEVEPGLKHGRRSAQTAFHNKMQGIGTLPGHERFKLQRHISCGLVQGWRQEFAKVELKTRSPECRRSKAAVRHLRLQVGYSQTERQACISHVNLFGAFSKNSPCPNAPWPRNCRLP